MFLAKCHARCIKNIRWAHIFIWMHVLSLALEAPTQIFISFITLCVPAHFTKNPFTFLCLRNWLLLVVCQPQWYSNVFKIMCKSINAQLENKKANLCKSAPYWSHYSVFWSRDSADHHNSSYMYVHSCNELVTCVDPQAEIHECITCHICLNFTSLTCKHAGTMFLSSYKWR